MAILATNGTIVYADARIGLPSEPLAPADLAAYVRDLLIARGLNPASSPEAISAAEHGAAILLAAYGALTDPPCGSAELPGIDILEGEHRP